MFPLGNNFLTSLNYDQPEEKTRTTNGRREHHKRKFRRSGNSRDNSEELKKLLNYVNPNHPASESITKLVKDPEGFRLCLEELDNMIGLTTIKDDIANQTMYLLESKRKGCLQKEMLNMVLTGSPGVGKTEVGTILAKLWYTMGFLGQSSSSSKGKGNNTKSSIFNFGESIKVISDIGREFNSSLGNDKDSGAKNNPEDIYVGFIVIFSFLSLGFKKLFDLVKTNVYIRYIFIVIVILIVVLFICWYTGSYPFNQKKSRVGQKASDSTGIGINLRSDNTRSTSETSNSETSNNETSIRKKLSDHIPDDVIKIVTRDSFVAEYLGQTDKKTKALLEQCKGKVLFIDEAYSLYQGYGDMYGLEALNIINLFLNQHPGELIIIFAGYEDLMNKGIFKMQPGLERRCMWHFSCGNYNSENLCDIFLKQIKEESYQVESKKKLRKLFNSLNVEKEFPSFGGDTKRLFVYTKIEHSKNRFMATNHDDDFILSLRDIKKGLRKLRQNIKNSNKGQKSNEKSNLDSFLSKLHAPSRE